MAYKDLDTFFDPDLKLPIKGTTYTVPSPMWEHAKRLREVVGAEGLPPVEQIDEAIKVLGSAFQEMVDDQVPWTMILHAGRTAIIHYGFNPDMAEIHWQMAHLGKLVDLEHVGDILSKLKQK